MAQGALDAVFSTIPVLAPPFPLQPEGSAFGIVAAIDATLLGFCCPHHPSIITTPPPRAPLRDCRRVAASPRDAVPLTCSLVAGWGTDQKVLTRLLGGLDGEAMTGAQHKWKVRMT